MPKPADVAQTAARQLAPAQQFPPSGRGRVGRYRLAHRARGLCAWCSRKALPNMILCSVCRNKARVHTHCERCGGALPKYHKRWCLTCGPIAERESRKPYQRAYQRAHYHTTKHSPAYKAAHRKAARAYQARHRAAGLCIRCARPARPERATCAEHARA